MSKRRFPGINPFQTDEQDRFFGREEDINDLYALLLIEKIVVLFGKSGHGKSSLLNAGIVPRFLKEQPQSERRYKPVIIKFGAWQEGKQPPVETAKLSIQNALGARIDSPALSSVESLWYGARKSGFARILLVFDQFEEFFTYPLAQQQRFAAELGELLHTDLPPALAERYAELPESEQDFLAEKMDVKAVFAIREDRLHLLDKLKYPLPTIFARRYPLLPLPRAKAAEAIANPAEMTGDFDTPPFTFSKEALNTLLDYLDDIEGRVETNQLQIIAESLERRSDHEGIQVFTLENLGNLKSIVADYYRERLYTIPLKPERLAVRRLCEEGLAQEGDPPMRLSLHEAQIRNFYGIEPALLEQLVQNRLLRAEPSGSRSGYTYELPHDTLLEPVLDAKRERLEDEAFERERKAQELAEARARVAEKKAEEEKHRAEEAEKLKDAAVSGRRRARWFALSAGVVALIAIVLFDWALYERAASQKSLADYQLADRKRAAAEAVNKAAQIANLKKKIEGFINAEAFGLAQDSLSVLITLNPHDPDIPKLETQIK